MKGGGGEANNKKLIVCDLKSQGEKNPTSNLPLKS